ncbi:MAG: carbohydrate porin [Roseiarcus sp.]
MASRFHRFEAIFAVSACLSAHLPAHAEEGAGAPQPSLSSNLPEPFGSFGGLRPILARQGITFQLNYLSDPEVNVSGGLKQGGAYAGRLEAIVEADLETALGLKGATFHVGSYQIHGNGPSQHFVGVLSFESDVEALPTTRLDEIWLEQKLLNDRASIRLGQLAADVEFSTSPSLDLIIGGAFGWHPAFAANLPSGGPAYPFATPGVRLKYEPTDNIAVLAALFDGDPAGPGPGDPQLRNRYGLNFRMNDPPFVITELQLKFGRDAKGDGLGGTIKLGGWRHFGRFADLRFGLDGLPLADPTSAGLPLEHQGDFGVYGLIDQQIFRRGGDAGPGVYAFARIATVPSDRNLVDFYADAGLNFRGMIETRPDDSFGIAGSFAKISGNARGADLDANLFDGAFAPIRDYEASLEATYNFGIVPGWSVQPNIQYVLHPGGHIADSSDPIGTRAIPNAFVIGMRTSIKY